MKAISIKQSYISIMVSILLGMLFILSCTTFWYQSMIITDQNIVNDIGILSSIFKKINDDCTIVEFKFQHNNYIDYLQVISFEGSEIGSMTLRYPKKWRGPYLRDNLMVQGKFYQIVKTHDGHFIVPGDGVTLQKGKIIGKDIIFDLKANIPAMMQNPEMLQFQGKPLAVRIEIGSQKPVIPLENEVID